MINFSDLVLEQLAFELRYENAYLYWDNSGKIWREILNKWPSAKADTIDLKEAKIVIPEKEINLTFSPKSIVLTQSYAPGVTDIGEFGDLAVNTIREFLDISVFTRVGNRFIYMLKIQEEREALDLMQQTGFFTIPKEKVSNIGDYVKSPALRFQVTKGNEIGYGIRLEHTNRTLNIKLPKPIKVDQTKFITSGLIVDIDFFTLKPVECGNVMVHELIKKNHRDMEPLITGLFR